MIDIAIQRPQVPYRGRFAPSPSGLLHFGSLVTALASYLDAKSQQGEWLVRIEDIDPPREMKGASQLILDTLFDFGLHWDGDIVYQSQRTLQYQKVLSQLLESNSAYACQCTRAKIKAIGGIYQGHCRNRNQPIENSALRVKNLINVNQYNDLIQGSIQGDPALANEDFVVLRRDGLFAYQLAVVVDDIAQGITHVIRGCDLLEPTVRQLTFIRQLGFQTPQYGHIPLAVTEQGYKLSKQNKAPAVDRKHPEKTLFAALQFLGQHPSRSLALGTKEELIAWATEHWQLNKVPKQREIIIA